MMFVGTDKILCQFRGVPYQNDDGCVIKPAICNAEKCKTVILKETGEVINLLKEAQ